MALPEFSSDMNIIQKLDDEPNDVGGLSAQDLKKKFDEAGLTIQKWLNEVFLPALIAANIKFAESAEIPEVTVQAAIENVQEQLKGLVIGQVPNKSVAYAKLAEDVTSILTTLRTELTTAQTDITEIETEQTEIANSASSCGVAAMRNLGLILALRAHSGERMVTDQGIIADAFQDTSLIDTYSGGLLFRNKRLELAVVQPASGTVNFNGSKDFNASIITGEVSAENEWVDLFTFRPEGYCTITKLTLKTISSTTTGTPASMKLSVWKGTTKLCETPLRAINRDENGVEPAVEFAVNQYIDPNIEYTMKLWIGAKTESTATLSYVKFDVNPSSYNTGTATCSRIPLLNGAKRVEVLVHATAAVPTVSVRFASSGSFTMLTVTSIHDVTMPDGTTCKLRRYRSGDGTVVPAGATQVQVRLSVSGSSCKIYDYALIQLPWEE